MNNKINSMKSWGLLMMAILLLSTSNLQAQKSYKLSAKQAVDLALKNVTELKNLEIDRELQISKNKRMRLRPQKHNAH
jgi:hypothetical protein